MSKGLLKNLFLIFPCIFAVEMVLGFTGRLLFFGPLSIRMVLFALAFASLYSYVLVYSITNKKNIFNIKEKSCFLGSFSLMEWGLIGLFIATAFFAVVVPKIKGGSIAMAIDEINCIATLLLLFPLSYLIKQKEISSNKASNFIEVLVGLLGVLHIVLYVGQKFSTTFIEDYFVTIIRLLGGSGEVPFIIFGHGYVRVIYTTSILLLLGLYFLFKNIKKPRPLDYFCYAASIVGLLTTITKSLWLGCIVCIIIFFVAYLIMNFKTVNIKAIVKLSVTLVLTLCVIFALDVTLFNGIIAIRTLNLFSSSVGNEDQGNNQLGNEEEEKPQTKPDKFDNELQKLDQEGSTISNDLRYDQMSALIGKWKESPVVGFGYGSYTEDCIRNVDSPYSYEMTAFALLMKVGILGMITWAVFFIIIIITKAKDYKKDKNSFWAWLAFLVGFGVSVQTNPYLFNFVGMSLLLFVMFESYNSKYLSEDNNEN